MKSKIVDTITVTRGFPKLQKSTYTGAIYIMLSSNHGIVVSTALLKEGLSLCIGSIDRSIPIKNLQDFDGAIMLSND